MLHTTNICILPAYTSYKRDFSYPAYRQPNAAPYKTIHSSSLPTLQMSFLTPYVSTAQFCIPQIC